MRTRIARQPRVATSRTIISPSIKSVQPDRNLLNERLAVLKNKIKANTYCYLKRQATLAIAQESEALYMKYYG